MIIVCLADQTHPRVPIAIDNKPNEISPFYKRHYRFCGLRLQIETKPKRVIREWKRKKIGWKSGIRKQEEEKLR